MKKAGIFFADGFEEIEALTVVDLLRRAGIEALCVSIANKEDATGSHGIRVAMDEAIDKLDFDSLDIIICPGGMPGTKNLEKCGRLVEKIKEFYNSKKLIAAICAAPMIFGHLGLVDGKEACIYPGMENELTGANVVYDKVVKADNVITSRGMGTAIPFGLEIVASLIGRSAADDLAERIVYTN